MLSALLFAVATCSMGMVIDYPAMEKSQTEAKGSMVIQFDGELHRTVDEDKCLGCCRTTFATRKALWQHAQTQSLFRTTGGLNALDMWNVETEEKFAKCGASTTESVIYSSHEQLFMSWGILQAKIDSVQYCSKACRSITTEITQLHESVLAELVKDQQKAVGDISSDIAHDLGTPNSLAALEYKASQCSDGCYVGEHYTWGQGAKGDMCVTPASAGTLKISKTTWATKSIKGNCNNLEVSVENGKITGGEGKCKVMNYITSTQCIGPNKMRVNLIRSPHEVTVSKASGFRQLLEYADEEQMSIDHLLDHPEHGPHAQNLLVDFYKDSLEAGESLLEMARRDAQNHNHTLILEHRHLEKAEALHSQLPESDKKHNFVPVGYKVAVRMSES